jgi:peroxiredoxin/mono/diheme cytochrome c family protein
MNTVAGFGVWSAVAAAFLATRPATAQEGTPPLERTVRIQDAPSLGVGRLIPDLDLTPLDGKPTRLSALSKDKKAVVFAMTSAGCPVSMKYSARLAAFEDEYAKKGVAFVYVNTVDAETPEEMRRQAAQYRFDGPYLPDRTRAVVRALGARTTTEVFVLDPARTLLYRGAVDDQHGIGKSLDAPQRHFLREALDAAIVGDRPRVRATWPPGCVLEVPEAAPAPATGLSYSGRIARIIADNCLACHRPGGAAPFALDTYAGLTGRAAMVEAVVRDGLMPPWHGSTHPVDEPSPWVNDRSLDPRDRDDLLTWLKSDRAQGDPADAPAPLAAPSNTWTIGKPDILLTPPGFRLTAEGGMQSARSMMAFGGAEDVWVTAFEFRPVEANSLHHALVWLLGPGDRLPEPGKTPAGLELVGTYSPGDSIVRYPANAARKVRAGSLLIIDAYARPMGKEVIAALRIAARTGPEPVFAVRTLTDAATSVSTGPDGAHGAATTAVSLPDGGTLLAILPSMRSYGRTAMVEAALPDGAVQRLLEAPRYDFRWQIRYEFIEPPAFPAGTHLRLGGIYDFSGSERPIRVGTGSGEESLLLAVEVLEKVRPR